MADLIDRQGAIDAIRNKLDNWLGDDQEVLSDIEYGMRQGFRVAEILINGLPSAERKGKWIHDPDPDAGLGWYTCSECGHNDYEDPDFCPNCGADMRGEEDE